MAIGRTHALLEQLELKLAELEETASESEMAVQIAAVAAAREKVVVQAFQRKGPHAGPCRSICRASASFIPAQRLVPAAAREAAQDRRGCDRDAGGGPAPVESDPACPREVLLPDLREDQPAAGPVASHCSGVPGPRSSPECCSPNTACTCR